MTQKKIAQPTCSGRERIKREVTQSTIRDGMRNESYPHSPIPIIDSKVPLITYHIFVLVLSKKQYNRLSTYELTPAEGAGLSPSAIIVSAGRGRGSGPKCQLTIEEKLAGNL